MGSLFVTLIPPLTYLGPWKLMLKVKVCGNSLYVNFWFGVILQKKHFKSHFFLGELSNIFLKLYLFIAKVVSIFQTIICLWSHICSTPLNCRFFSKLVSRIYKFIWTIVSWNFCPWLFVISKLLGVYFTFAPTSFDIKPNILLGDLNNHLLIFYRLWVFVYRDSKIFHWVYTNNLNVIQRGSIEYHLFYKMSAFLKITISVIFGPF